VARKKIIIANSTTGLRKVVEMTGNKEARVEVIDLTMLQLRLEECRTGVVLEVELLEVVITEEINYRQIENTTGANTLKFVRLLPRGLEVMEDQHHWVLIGTFAEEVVSMEVPAHGRLIIHLGHQKVVIVAVATTLIEATITESLLS
jgi:hypothetical protein